MSVPVPKPLPPRPRDAHKGTAGRVLQIAGSDAMPGASILAARAALRAGAGLLTACARGEAHARLLIGAAPELVLAKVEDRLEPSADELDRLIAIDVHARLAGPGLGASPWTRAIVEALVDRTDGPLVLDADALNVLAGEPERLAKREAPIVITPHPGEAGRLLGRRIPSDDAGRRAAADELAERTGAIVCLKGRATVVASAGRVFVNDTGNPGMASGGSGDVLAGILLAYLGQSVTLGSNGVFEPWDAAVLAVHVHGAAGDLAAQRLGERALIASDLVDELPAAQRGRGG